MHVHVIRVSFRGWQGMAPAIPWSSFAIPCHPLNCWKVLDSHPLNMLDSLFCESQKLKLHNKHFTMKQIEAKKFSKKLPLQHNAFLLQTLHQISETLNIFLGEDAPTPSYLTTCYRMQLWPRHPLFLKTKIFPSLELMSK